MPLDLYCMDPSPPNRAVYLCIQALGLNVNKKPINLFTKEQLDPEFVKINPQHTLPTLVDDGFAIWDSHAINAYLVNKYAKDDTLYPKDPQKRAIVDQRLHFDSGVLFPRMRDITGTIIFHGAHFVAEMSRNLITPMDVLNKFVLDAKMSNE